MLFLDQMLERFDWIPTYLLFIFDAQISLWQLPAQETFDIRDDFVKVFRWLVECGADHVKSNRNLK